MQTADLIGTAPEANAMLKQALVVDTLNTVGVVLAPAQLAPASHASSCPQGVDALAAAARKLSPTESAAAVLCHVDSELERSRAGGWRRLLPSARSADYMQFFAEERRALNQLPFACG